MAYNRMKYELENRDKAGLAGQAFGVAQARSGCPRRCQIGRACDDALAAHDSG